MKHKERIPKALFREDGHYLGRPADAEDRIVSRRIRLVESIPDFTGKDYMLLDIGCGNGSSMLMLADKMKYCTGLEITSENQEEFELNKAKLNIHNCEYRITDIDNSTPSEKYDRIISFEVIEHLSDESSVQYYFDSLKDDGLMAITVPNKWWIFETHGAKLPFLPWNRIPFFSWLPRFLHERLANARIYTKSRIRKLLERHGFEILRMHYITAPMDVLPAGAFREWIIRNIFKNDITQVPFKSTSIFVLARKKSHSTILPDSQ